MTIIHMDNNIFLVNFIHTFDFINAFKVSSILLTTFVLEISSISPSLELISRDLLCLLINSHIERFFNTHLIYTLQRYLHMLKVQVLTSTIKSFPLSLRNNLHLDYGECRNVDKVASGFRV